MNLPIGNPMKPEPFAHPSQPVRPAEPQSCPPCPKCAGEAQPTLDIRDQAQVAWPAAPEIMPEFPIFKEHTSLTELADQTALKLAHSRSPLEEHRILDKFVNELNRAEGWLTSYPPKPLYAHSKEELRALAAQVSQKIEELRHIKCNSGPLLEGYEKVLDGIKQALNERQNAFFPKPGLPMRDDLL